MTTFKFTKKHKEFFDTLTPGSLHRKLQRWGGGNVMCFYFILSNLENEIQFLYTSDKINCWNHYLYYGSDLILIYRSLKVVDCIYESIII